MVKKMEDVPMQSVIDALLEIIKRNAYEAAVKDALIAKLTACDATEDDAVC
jgi:hypothetical protein